MQKQGYYYCSGNVSQVLQNLKTRRPRHYPMISYEQIRSCYILHNICQMKGDSYIDNDDVLEHTLQRGWERTQRREERKFHASANTFHSDGQCKC